MDQLRPASLDWALTHIRRYGDTDIFPVPFEFNAIAHSWNYVRPELERLDMATYVPGAIQHYLVPKPGGGFRVAVQLDPFDTIIYTALVYEAAELIERSRVAPEQRVACSYRVELDANGSFFAPESGWPDFHQRSAELAATHTHVLLADIADFYNQVYIHRVENALETANLAQERVKNINNFLLSLNARQSRGLAVGPSASILLAEAALNDVDMFLLRKGTPHVRYVDDFRVFCHSRREALQIQHDLTEYLYTAHRLSLALHKTRIIHTTKFTAEELRDPEDEEKTAKTAKLRELVRELRRLTGYHIEPDDLPGDDVANAIRAGLADLFDSCVNFRPLHLGLARHLLRRALALKTSVIAERVFESLELLSPVLRDTARYIIGSVPAKAANSRGDQLVQFVETSDVGPLPYIRLWFLEVLHQRPDMVTPETASRLAMDSVPHLGLRYAALTARTYGQVDWVRARKETWRNHGPFDRRAIIWSSCALPKGERRPWLEMVMKSGDVVDRAVAQFAAAQP